MKTTKAHTLANVEGETPEANHSELFDSQGYFLASKLIPEELCISLIDSFKRNIKPFKGGLNRVTTAKSEPHHISDHGLIVNPILNVHHLEQKSFDEVRISVLNILSQDSVQQYAAEFTSDIPVLIQSGYFESSLGSVPHIDSYFFDSKNQTLVACWIALEDIDQGSGQFSVYPGSHRLGIAGAYSEDVFQKFHAYEEMAKDILKSSQIKREDPPLSQVIDCRKLLDEIIKQAELKPFKPELKRGDVVFFSSKTIHGSDMPSRDAENLSRHSLIAHFTPQGQKLIRYGVQETDLDHYTEYGMQIEHSHFN